MYHRPRTNNPIAIQFERYVKRKILPGCSGDMFENHVQHIGIHPKGLAHDVHTSNHKHFIFPNGKKITKFHVDLIIDEAVKQNLIYPGGYTPTYNPHKRAFIRSPNLTDSRVLQYKQQLKSSIMIV